CKEFIQYRGAAGATLVINFDFFLLLTNLCIGENEKLRLNELLIEMRKRGIYFDKKSLVEIINFYERVGNVERMSDSGDAIYVKKTI
ncbi:DNA phosphorothioation-dependent restriction protein DptG, partial [Acinetobacter baumannii]